MSAAKGADVFAGVDLGGTTISAALADGDGKTLCERQVDTLSHKGPEAVLRRIGELVGSLAQDAGTTPQALGMGVPGLVDVRTGVTKFLPNLPTHWRDVPAAELLAQHVGCPVHLLNDVRTATLGELTFGHGRDLGGSGTLTFFSLGTGIGGGVAIDGKLRLGPLGAAGELGHQTILPDGPLCGCGNHGCLEALASGPALIGEGVRLMKIGLAPKLFERIGGHAERITPKEMAAAAEAGDEAIADAIQRAAGYLGIGVANVVTTLHPDLVVLGGGVAEMGDVLLDRVREVMLSHVRMFPADGVRIERSRLGSRAGVIGAAALAMRGGVV